MAHTSIENFNMLRLFGFLLIIAFVLAIFIWNLNLRKKVHVEHEHYRTLIHEAVLDGIEANELQSMNPITALTKVCIGQTKIKTASQMVGGLVPLAQLAGIDVTRLLNTLVFQERQIRAIISSPNHCVVQGHDLTTDSFEKVSAQNQNDDDL